MQLLKLRDLSRLIANSSAVRWTSVGTVLALLISLPADVDGQTRRRNRQFTPPQPIGVVPAGPIPDGAPVILVPVGPPVPVAPYGPPPRGPRGRRAPSPFLPPGPVAAYESPRNAVTIPFTDIPGGRPLQAPVNIASMRASAFADGAPGAAEDNLYVIVSEAFANRIVAEERSDADDVRDFVLGADVFGRQLTASRITVDFKPSESRGRFDMLLDGITQSETVGVTEQAVINTRGNYQFRAVKEVYFDGRELSTRKPYLFVDARNQVVGAQTQFSGVPLLGPLTDRIAVREAENRRDQSEAIARQRIAERVLPEFNTELDKVLREANVSLKETVQKRLKMADLAPHALRITTTETHACYHSRLAGEGEERGGPFPIGIAVPEAAVTIGFHESLLNNVVDRARLEGTSFTEEDLSGLGGQLRLIAPGLKVLSSPPPPSEDNPTVIVLADEHPIRLRIRDGRMEVTIRASFEPPDQPVVPQQEITIPLKFELIEDRLVISADQVTVAGPQGAEPPAEEGLQFEAPIRTDDEEGAAAPADSTLLERLMQAVRAGVLRQKLAETLPPTVLSREMVFDVRKPGDLRMRILAVHAVDGWLIFQFE